jgi:hypothetical protein
MFTHGVAGAVYAVGNAVPTGATHIFPVDSMTVVAAFGSVAATIGSMTSVVAKVRLLFVS